MNRQKLTKTITKMILITRISLEETPSSQSVSRFPQKRDPEHRGKIQGISLNQPRNKHRGNEQVVLVHVRREALYT